MTPALWSIHRPADRHRTVVRADVHERDVVAVEHPELDVEESGALVATWSIARRVLDVNHWSSARG